MNQAWHQLPNEGNAAYNAFRVGYLELGPERTFAQAADALGREPKIIITLAKKFNWIQRARSYDRWLFSVEENAIKKSTEKDASVWAQRRSQFRELEYSLAGELIEKAREILSLPIRTETIESDTLSEDGTMRHTVITITPVRATPRDAGMMIETASKLARLSASMETERKLLGIDITGDFGDRLQKARELYDRLYDQYIDRPDVLVNLAPVLAEQWGVEPHLLTEGKVPDQPEQDDVQPVTDAEN